MKKIIIILLLTCGLNSYGQTSIPVSGPITMYQIALVMANLGEISPIYLEPGTPYSIAFLNAASHLADKTAPYSLSDWYGYATTGTVYTHTYYAWNSDPGAICTTFGGSPVLYSTSAVLDVGTAVYSNSTLTTPSPNGAYRDIQKEGGSTPKFTVVDGIITSFGNCANTYAHYFTAYSEAVTGCPAPTTPFIRYSPSSILAHDSHLYLDPECRFPTATGTYKEGDIGWVVSFEAEGTIYNQRLCN